MDPSQRGGGKKIMGPRSLKKGDIAVYLFLEGKGL